MLLVFITLRDTELNYTLLLALPLKEEVEKVQVCLCAKVKGGRQEKLKQINPRLSYKNQGKVNNERKEIS